MLVCLFMVAATAQGAPRELAHDFDVRAGPLEAAIEAIGRQGGASIGVADAGIARLPVRALRTRTTVAAALERVLRGAPVRIVRIDANAYRIVRAPIAPAAPAQSRPAPPPPPQSGEVVVTASKRATLLTSYPGAVAVADVGQLAPGVAARGTAAIVSQLPMLASTQLGPGRDKLFVRGIADSSFNGLSQATVGEYLGDVRLTYSAPDPNLLPFDLRAIEVLEGPQGTLYGAGSLGGILRLEPNPPDLTRVSVAGAVGATQQAHGQPGYDLVAIANLPLARERAALRLVAYATAAGGYIDDIGRARKDVNDTRVKGVRGQLRWQPGAWTVDFGGVMQDIASRDGQYAERGQPPLTRRSALAQPFDNDYAMASVTVRRDVGTLRLTSASALVRHGLTSTYDAGPLASPTLFRQHERIGLLSNETRLTQTSGPVQWVAGVELLRTSERVTRRYGPVAAPTPITGVHNRLTEGSVFGEASVHLVPRVAVTGGARFVIDHRDDETFDTPGAKSEPSRTDHSFLPSLAALWTAGHGASVYVRYQEGFRAGGLSAIGSGTTAQRFESDTLRTIEAGVRMQRNRISGHVGVSRARWRNIQADLVTTAGFPFTANIGDGRVLGLEAESRFTPRAGTALDAGLFLNESNLDRPTAAFAGGNDRDLPNIPDLVARVGVRHTLGVAGTPVTLTGSARYVGRSRLAIGPTLDIRQGGYVETAGGLSLPLGTTTLSIDLTNPFDARGNRFALGNPFAVAAGRQLTPQAPRAIRIGLAAGF